MAAPSRDDRQVVLPTQERRRHGQELVTEDVVVKAAITRPCYDPVALQVEQQVVVPAETARVTRVTSSVVAMHARGRLTDEDVRSTERWYRDWSMVEQSCRSTAVSGTGRDPSGLSEAVLIATGELRAADAAIGRFGAHLLRELVGYGLTVKAIATARCIREDEMRGVCGHVIARLTEHYEDLNRVQHAKPKEALVVSQFEF